MRFGRRLWIYPWNVDPPADAAALAIVRLDPGLAFGTGTHPTTALCLEWLDAADLAGKTVIDYGCGSGVLAIAALKLGAQHVIAIDNDDQGPLWYRGLAQSLASEKGETLAAQTPAQIQPAGEDQLDALLSAYGARRIVVGHTPVLSGIALFHGGKLICIDTGISAVYGGTVSYLDIVDGTPVPHVVARSQQPSK